MTENPKMNTPDSSRNSNPVKMSGLVSGYITDVLEAKDLPPVNCSVCGKPKCLDLAGKWYVPDRRICKECAEIIDGKRSERELRERRAQLMSASGIPDRYKLKRLSQFDWTHPTLVKLRPVFDLCVRGKRGLVLSSEKPGNGKTHLLCWAIKMACVNEGKDGVFVGFNELINAIMADRRNAYKYLQCDRLAIDDVTVDGKVNEYAGRVFVDFVNDVYNRNGTHLFVSTNLNQSKMKAAFGENGTRLISRLTSLCEFVDISNAPDVRQKYDGEGR